MSTQPVKILHVVFSLDPGGMENGLVNVANALPRNKFEVHVCCLERAGAFVARLPQPENVRVLSKQNGFSLKTVFDLARVIKQIQPDLIHSHNLGPLIYASLATVFGRWKPIIHGEHGSLQPDQLIPRRIRARRFFYRTCRRVHTVSHSLTAQLREMGFSSSRLVTLVNGVDTNRFIPANRNKSREQIGLPQNAFVIGIVGRFVGLKRHEDLIHAFNSVAKSFPDAYLLIVGGGGEEEQKIVARVNSSPAKERIRITGFQNDPLPFYQAMDLLAVPSLHEGMSNVVLEAMSCGVPVLAHNVCGNAEVIAHDVDGIVADLGSIEKLQRELQKALNQRDILSIIGNKAREKALRQFSLASMAANYAKLYSELLKRT
jgi:glycosyltransferase involved in cell wall biosynthesis